LRTSGVLQLLAELAAELPVPGLDSIMQHGSEISWSGPHGTCPVQRKFWSQVRPQSRTQHHHRGTHWPSRAAASLRTDREETLHNGSASSTGLERELQEVRGGQASTSGKQHKAVLRATKSAAIPLRERERPLGVSFYYTSQVVPSINNWHTRPPGTPCFQKSLCKWWCPAVQRPT
jgi:hypothetical protein